MIAKDGLVVDIDELNELAGDDSALARIPILRLHETANNALVARRMEHDRAVLARDRNMKSTERLERLFGRGVDVLAHGVSSSNLTRWSAFF